MNKIKEIRNIGVISDTHGKLHKSIEKIFQDVDIIIHCGDIGKNSIIKKLESIAPVYAVLGNMDDYLLFPYLKRSGLHIQINEYFAYVNHEFSINEIYKIKSNQNLDLIMFGHTHMPFIKKENGILYINPGSAIQGRGSHPPSVGLLTIKNEKICPQIIKLN